MRRINTLGTANRIVWVYTDNQNALRAMAGGPTVGREYVKEFLEDVKALQERGRKVRGKWTPSHQGISGNEHADHRANLGH